MTAEEKTISVLFSGAATTALKKMQEDTGAGSIQKVVMEALMVYYALLDYKDSNNDIIVENPHGGRVKINLYKR